MPGQTEYAALEAGLAGLGDIGVEKADPRWQTRSQPGYFPPRTGSPDKPVLDPLECRPPEIPPNIPAEARIYLQFAIDLAEKTFATAVERAVGAVAERALARMAAAATPAWMMATQDSQPLDRFFVGAVPPFLGVLLPGSSLNNVVGTVGPFASRVLAYVTKVGTALESAAAFADVVWKVRINGQPVANIDDASGQWDTITGPAGGGASSTFGRAIFVPPGTTFQVLADNTALGNHFATLRIAGYLVVSPFLSSTITEAFQSPALASLQRFASPSASRVPPVLPGFSSPTAPGGGEGGK